FLRSGEIGVSVDVGEPNPPHLTAGAKQASQHDTAIATQDQHESAIRDAERDSIRERATVAHHAILVARTRGRASETPIGWGRHVAKIVGVELCHQPKLAKDRGGAVEVSSLSALIVGADADARRRSDDRNWTAHCNLP